MRAAAVVLALPRRIAGTSVFGKTLETVLAERPVPRDHRVAPRRRRARSRGPPARIGLESPSRHGKTPTGRARTGPGGQRPLLHRLWQRRVVDLLRARPRRLLRARPDPGRLHHHRVLLLLHRRELRRGDGDVPRGGRLVELRAARVQRVLVVLRRLGGDADLHGHDRHLGVLRAALHRRRVRVRRVAALEPRRHHRRHRGDRPAGRGQRVRREGVDRDQRDARGRRLPHPAAARGDRRGARALARARWSTTSRSASRRRGATSSSRSRSACSPTRGSRRSRTWPRRPRTRRTRSRRRSTASGSRCSRSTSRCRPSRSRRCR